MRAISLFLLSLAAPVLGAAAEPRFPEVRLADLEGRELTLPADLPAPRNLVVLAFERAHSDPAFAWLELGLALAGEQDGLGACEIPLMGDLGGFTRAIVNAAMRAEYKDHGLRERILPLYGPREPVLTALAVTATEHPLALLVDQGGAVSWSWSGERSPEAEQSLREALAR